MYNGFLEDNLVFSWVVIGIYTLTAFFLYFWAGKKFLSNTLNTLTNAFSVIVLVIILVVAAYVGGGAVNLPFYLLFELISFIFQMPYEATGDIYIYFVLAPLPSLIMLAGLTDKQRRETLNKNAPQNNEKSQSNMFILIKNIIKNNLIALTIHIGICVVFFFPGVFLGLVFWGESWTLFNMFLCCLVGIYTLFVLVLYLWAGKKFLSNTHNTLTNVLSVIALVIIFVIDSVYIWNDSHIWNDLLSWYCFMANAPFYPLLTTVSFILQIPYGAAEGIYIYLILAPLPSLLMLAGLTVKQRRDKLNKNPAFNGEVHNLRKNNEG